jgi:hypothetical protein
MATATKVIITSRSALAAKYGTAGMKRVNAAIRALVAADRVRGIGTRVVSINPPPDAATVKARIDALCTPATPDYLMLLGAADVVPQCTLDNPLWTGDPRDDADPVVPSDLPYAYDAPLSRSCGAYRGPTRVLGRLPDLVGADNPDYLIGLLHAAASWTSLVAPRPLGVLAISTLTWRRSTQTSIAALSGALGPIHTTPIDGPAWTRPQLDTPLLFVNCHGGQFDPRWYGEKFRNQQTLPVSVDAARLGIVGKGMVVAAECCYATMHWNPQSAAGQPSVAATLLAQGAVGVFGSSTISYGPTVGNGSADIIARMFLETVVAGGSLGRAALTARQRFVANAATLDPTDAKTLAQFDLWGDPSVQPIAVVGATPHDAPVAAGSRPPPGLRQRRAALESIGRALESSVGAANDAPRLRAGLTRRRFSAVTGADASAAMIRTFDVPAGTDAYHVAFVGTGRRRSLLVVRTEPGQQAEVRRLERK